MSTQTSTARSIIASLPRIAVRTRNSENQMAMFSVVSVGAIAFMMLLPSPRAAFAAVEPETHTVAMQAVGTGAPVFAVMSEADRACEGQAWGSETLECVLAIARASGLSRTVRFADATGRQ